jgi:hypothetical protein
VRPHDSKTLQTPTGVWCARFSLARWPAGGMASSSGADLPVLEDWHFNAKYRRPKECGVVGCAAQLSTRYQKRYRICAAHMSSTAVLCRGVPHRWCARCRHFDALDAFRGCQRCVPASQLKQALHTFRADSTSPRRVAMCSLRTSKVPCCMREAWLRMHIQRGGPERIARTARQELHRQPPGSA